MFYIVALLMCDLGDVQERKGDGLSMMCCVPSGKGVNCADLVKTPEVLPGGRWLGGSGSLKSHSRQEWLADGWSSPATLQYFSEDHYILPS